MSFTDWGKPSSFVDAYRSVNGYDSRIGEYFKEAFSVFFSNLEIVDGKEDPVTFLEAIGKRTLSPLEGRTIVVRYHAATSDDERNALIDEVNAKLSIIISNGKVLVTDLEPTNTSVLEAPGTAVHYMESKCCDLDFFVSELFTRTEPIELVVTPTNKGTHQYLIGKTLDMALTVQNH
jgi:hypothetical protein